MTITWHALTCHSPLSRGMLPSMEIRDRAFGESGVRRHWHGGRAAVTSFFDTLSIFFPAGERFFIASVNAHREHILDEELLKEVRTFICQEALHTREHVRYN